MILQVQEYLVNSAACYQSAFSSYLIGGFVCVGGEGEGVGRKGHGIGDSAKKIILVPSRLTKSVILTWPIDSF